MCSVSPHSPKLRSSEALGTSSLHAIFYEQEKRLNTKGKSGGGGY